MVIGRYLISLFLRRVAKDGAVKRVRADEKQLIKRLRPLQALETGFYFWIKMTLRRLIIDTGPGQGLCNRLRPIVSAMRLAEFSGRRLSIVWHNYSHVNRGCACDFNDLFTNDIEQIKSLKEIEARSIKIYNYENHFSKGGTDFYPDKANDIIDVHSRDEVVYVKGTYFIYDITDSTRKSEAYKEFAQYFRRLKPIRYICKKANEFKRENYSKPILGVHARLKNFYVKTWLDHLKVRGLRLKYPRSENDYYEEIDKYLAEYPKARIFLSADNKKSENAISHRYKDRLIKYPVRTFSRNTRAGLQDALINIYLLNHTDLVLRSRFSSFSEMSSIMTKYKIL